MKKLLFATAIILSMLSLSLFAQEKVENTKTLTENNESAETTGSEKLGKIVVTPTKTRHCAGDVPASMAVITSEDITASTAQFADQTMKSTAGVYQKRSKFADTTTSVNIRGFNSSSRNLVLLDGMPLNDAYSAGVNWSSISKDNIQQIEVVKGPFSSLYGRNAMGGVINIITKSPTKKEISVNSGYGSFNTYTGHAAYGDLLWGKLGIYASFDYRTTDGDRTNSVRKSFSSGAGTTAVSGAIPATATDGSSTTSGGSPYFVIGDKGNNFWNQWICAGKIFYDFDKNSRVSFLYNIQKYEYGYRNGKSYLKNSNGYPVNDDDVTVTHEGTQYHKSITPYNFISGDGENFNQLYSLDFNTTILDSLDFKTKLGYNEVSNWYTTPKSGSDFSGGKGELNKTSPKSTVYFDMQLDLNLNYNTFIMSKQVFTIGASERYDYARGEQWKLTDWKNPDSKLDAPDAKFSFMKGQQALSSVYTQLELGILDKIMTLYAGARYDHWVNFDGQSRYNATEKSYSKTDDWQISPKVSVVVKPPLKLAGNVFSFDLFRMSYGHAFAPPQIFKLYKYWEYFGKQYNPNPDLKPEKTKSWEAGCDFSFFNKTVMLTGTYFGSIITDMMYNRQIDATTKKYENAGEGLIHGCESEIRIFIPRLFMIDCMEIYGNITYLNTEITENEADPDSEGKQFEDVPELMYNAGITAHLNYFEVNVNWSFKDKVFGDSDNADIATGTYGAYDKVMLLDAKVSFKPDEKFRFSLSVENILDRDYYQYYRSPGRTWFAEAEIKL